MIAIKKQQIANDDEAMKQTRHYTKTDKLTSQVNPMLKKPTFLLMLFLADILRNWKVHRFKLDEFGLPVCL